jgi:hypothetical protein
VTNKTWQPIWCHCEIPFLNFSKSCWLPAKDCQIVCLPFESPDLGTSKPGAFVTFKDPNSSKWFELCDCATINCVSQIPFSGGGSKFDPFFGSTKFVSGGQQQGGQQQGPFFAGGQQQGGQQQGPFFAGGQQQGGQQSGGTFALSGGQQGGGKAITRTNTFTKF